MKEIVLLKYGELALKGTNRSTFESILIKNIRRRLRDLGEFSIVKAQSTITVSPKADDVDMDEVFDRLSRVFGIVALSRSAVIEKDFNSILNSVEYLDDALSQVSTFKVNAKRSDKKFPMGSPEICAELGGCLLERHPHLSVDVHNPDLVVWCEIRDHHAFLHAGQQSVAGGIPVGSGGRAALLLSGGIDSPVAGYMIAKRGIKIEALYFESFPYTSEQAREKVFDLAKKISAYTGSITVHVVSLTEIQEELVRKCDEDYFTLLLRRFMMRLAKKVANKYECPALITGESLGQVASQTIEAISVTNPIAEMPVFRPCIGMDKEEIITISRQIGTFDISILPYEDCCTVFTPKHPRTRPELAKVEAQEEKLDVDALVERAFDTMFTEYFKAEF